jgi:hypothetical protein
MVHMKAKCQLTASKDMDTYPKIRKYDIEASLWCRPRSSYLNSAIATES